MARGAFLRQPRQCLSNSIELRTFFAGSSGWVAVDGNHLGFQTKGTATSAKIAPPPMFDLMDEPLAPNPCCPHALDRPGERPSFLDEIKPTQGQIAKEFSNLLQGMWSNEPLRHGDFQKRCAACGRLDEGIAGSRERNLQQAAALLGLP